MIFEKSNTSGIKSEGAYVISVFLVPRSSGIIQMTVMSDQMITDAIMNGAPFICWIDASVLSSLKSVLSGMTTFFAFVFAVTFVFVMSVIFLYPLDWFC